MFVYRYYVAGLFELGFQQGAPLHSVGTSHGFLNFIGYLNLYLKIFEIDLLKKLSNLSCELSCFLDIADCTLIFLRKPIPLFPVYFLYWWLDQEAGSIFRLHFWQDYFINGVLNFHQERHNVQLSTAVALGVTEDHFPDPEFTLGFAKW